MRGGKSLQEILSVRAVSKFFGAFQALKDVTFGVRPGEVHCLLGENGAGKSTLIKILSGALTPEAGSIQIDGREYAGLTPVRSMELGIATIYQDVELIETLTVSDNIFLGEEISGALGVVRRREQFRRAREIMDRLHIDIDETKLVGDLSQAQKQMLQIVKALKLKARILIMDEPTSSLGVSETRALMDMVRKLKDEGVAIIYISHYLEEIFQIGDRITVLKDGASVATYEVRDVDVATVVKAMVGREASLFYKRDEIVKGEGLLQIRDFTRSGVVDHVSFDVRQGEIFGLGGLVGSGRSELLDLIFGAAKKDGGAILLDGREVRIDSPGDAMRQGFSYITEDRKKLALFMDRPVRENIAIVEGELFGGALVSASREASEVRDMAGKMRIAMFSPEQRVGDLSGGNQQKVVIARWLLSRGKVFLFDEPTKGVDIGAREEIYRLMTDLAKAGHYIIMVSSDMPELLSMSDTIGVMQAGRLKRVFTGDIREEELMNCYLGVVE
jgi:ribose transport system ATP-binding protein